MQVGESGTGDRAMQALAENGVYVTIVIAIIAPFRSRIRTLSHCTKSLQSSQPKDLLEHTLRSSKSHGTDCASIRIDSGRTHSDHSVNASLVVSQAGGMASILAKSRRPDVNQYDFINSDTNLDSHRELDALVRTAGGGTCCIPLSTLHVGMRSNKTAKRVRQHIDGAAGGF